MYILNKIAKDLLVSEKLILAISNGAAMNYKRFETKSGRIIWQPSPQLKLIQYWVVDFLRSCSCTASRYSTAYEPKCNIFKNANMHTTSNHLLRMDIQQFFPSVGDRLIVPVLEDLDSPVKLSQSDIELLLRIVLLNGGLTIGAPSSPFLANRVMKPVDKRLVEVARSYDSKMIYTRYSDDLFFSSRNYIDKEMSVTLQGVLEEYDLRANVQKTRFMGSGSNKMMAGLVINDKHKVSLGQKRKKQLRYELYTFMKNESPQKKDAHRILGLIMFAKSIEPMYTNRMLVKYSGYGGDVMLRIHKTINGEQFS